MDRSNDSRTTEDTINPDNYRREDGCLFEYDPARHAFVLVYRNDRLRTKAALIQAYRARQQSDY